MKKTVIWLILLLSVLFSVNISALEEEISSITSLRLVDSGKKLRLEATLSDDYIAANKGGTLYVFSIAPYQSASNIADMTPCGTVTASKKITFEMSVNAGDRTVLFDKYLLAEISSDGALSIVTGAKYIENIDIMAKHSQGYPKYASKKGLHTQLLADAQELGISHTVINVAVNEYLVTDGSGNAVSFIYDNVTYYVSADKIALLDSKIKLFTESGVNVYLNILLTRPSADMPEELNCLYAEQISSSVMLYSFNTKNRDSVMYLEALLTFLAERYTAPDGPHGFAGSFIFGYQINSGGYLDNMTVDDYLNSYITALRIADTALRSVYSNGRIYISLSNKYNTDIGDRELSAGITGKELLDALCEKISYAGDIPWNVAINPYPSNILLTEFWEDDAAFDDQTTPYITMKNISVLCELFEQEKYLYNGASRRIAVSSFGINGEEGTDSAEMQAAAFAYAYYKAEADPRIESFIYYRHVDHASENGIYFGLWSRKEGTALSPENKKPIYELLKYIDSERSAEVSEFALELLGARSWTDLVPNFHPASVSSKKIISGTPVLLSDIEKKNEPIVLYDFGFGTLHGFLPTDTASYMELRADKSTEAGKPALYAKLTALTDTTKEYMGIGKYYDEKIDLSGIDYISLHIKADTPEEITNVNVMLRFYNAQKKAVYEGAAQMRSNSWDNVTFDISGFSEKFREADSIKIWIRSYDGQSYEGNFGMWLDTVTVYKKSGFPIAAVLIILVVIIVLAAAVFGIYLFVKRKKVLAARSRRRRIK